jgi:3-oxoacyl-[acyl-carrier protein] reductase
MDLNLRNKTALVTGGSRGLGRAICLALAREGSRVAVNYRHARPEALAVVGEIAARFGTSAVALAADVSQPQEVVQLIDAAEAELGPIDVLVNNAGVWPAARVTDITVEQWDQTMAINLRAPFLTCREVVRRWLAAGRGGRIVNIVSSAAFLGATTGHAHYAASKAGLVTFTVSLAREVASHGIYVNAVAPGMMATDMAREALETNLQHYLDRIPMQRIAEPEEVADAVVFVASDRAGYTTGATLDVSGGLLMR